MAKFQVVFDSDVCKGCELCRASCPKGIIEMSGEINSKGYSPAAVTRGDECIGCSSCALVCPDGAIEIFREEAVPQ
ncbi:MAG: 4Fe-4S dicluster domain-containing protein [Oscillospiraceae bacterium]|jgi:2-oxoglutarate ferredoxin oxidoreductase subunit delta|nr:4Fe-4S dicluster domain-containing protein [Oscillospiraceae bacterium]